jgi:hypothetical protein
MPDRRHNEAYRCGLQLWTDQCLPSLFSTLSPHVVTAENLDLRHDGACEIHQVALRAESACNSGRQGFFWDREL